MRSVPPRSVVNAPLESARRHGRSGATTVKTRDSGMPDEELWASFFAPAKEIAMLGLNADIGNAADFGCGYGTFAVPAAKVVRGTVYALDIDPAMVAATRARADAEGVRNVEANARDIVACGTGLPDAAVDYVMLFNILHCEDPLSLLREARRVLAPGGTLAVMHWNYDASTPRGPSSISGHALSSAGHGLSKPALSRVRLPRFTCPRTITALRSESLPAPQEDSRELERPGPEPASDATGPNDGVVIHVCYVEKTHA